MIQRLLLLIAILLAPTLWADPCDSYLLPGHVKDLPMNSWSNAFLSLMAEERQVAQTSPELLRAGLPAGSCGQTCALNVMRSYYRYTGRTDLDMAFDGASVAIMQELFRISTSVGIPAGKGVNAPTLAFMLDILLKDNKQPLQLETRRMTLFEGPERSDLFSYVADFSKSDLELRENQIAIISTFALPDLEVGHALVLLGYNHQTNEISVSDPNFPNLVGTFKLKTGVDGLQFVYADSRTYRVIDMVVLTR